MSRLRQSSSCQPSRHRRHLARARGLRAVLCPAPGAERLVVPAARRAGLTAAAWGQVGRIRPPPVVARLGWARPPRLLTRSRPEQHRRRVDDVELGPVEEHDPERVALAQAEVVEDARRRGEPAQQLREVLARTHRRGCAGRPDRPARPRSSSAPRTSSRPPARPVAPGRSR